MQTAEEFLASVGDTDDGEIKGIFDLIDILDDSSTERHDIDEVASEKDFDPEDEYYNEVDCSGSHVYRGFDDPEAEGYDDWIE